MRPIAGFLALVLAVPLLTPKVQADGDEIAVVVNRANPAQVLSRDDLRVIFQTSKTAWSDGTKATPVNLPDDDPVRQKFDVAVLGLDPERVSRYWIDRKVRGGNRPPQKVSSESGAIRVVSSDPGGVGYVPSGAAGDSVKIVARIRAGQVVAP
jgi:ABC-type phosphate transport system substrate-binding protein